MIENLLYANDWDEVDTDQVKITIVYNNAIIVDYSIEDLNLIDVNDLYQLHVNINNNIITKLGLYKHIELKKNEVSAAHYILIKKICVSLFNYCDFRLKFYIHYE